MKIIEGDLIKLAQAGQFDVIIHGCNCQCTMGSGIAKTVREVFPDAYAVDCETTKGDRYKLGQYSHTSVDADTDVGKLYIINGYTQFNYNPSMMNADYDAIRGVFKKVKKAFGGMRIGYPMIGAGLAGGDWNIISAIIEEELEGEDHTFVKFVPGK